jgi:acetyl esterase/lipase
VKQFIAFFVAGLMVCAGAHAQTATPAQIATQAQTVTPAQTATPAKKKPCATEGSNNDFLGIQTIRLWPGDAPEAKGTACEDIPTLTVFEPQGGSGIGSAVIILPGGAYSLLAGNIEGRQVADWFAARGFRAFVLSYRLSSNGYILPVPLLDARRAVQTVRARASDYKIDPNRIVIIGFSAGGHLAALSATQFVPGNPDSADPIEKVSSRPDYLVLGYPWIGAITLNPEQHLTYCKLFKLMDRCEELRVAYSPDLFVTKDTPPTFLYHTSTDKTVPVDQSLRFYEALIKAGVPSEAHIFSNGPHGTGLGKGDAALDQWPNLLEIWLRAQGLLTPVKPVDAPKPK